MEKPNDKIKLFENRRIRSVWDEEGEKWWFSVIDIIAALTGQPDYTKVRNYWKWLKGKLVEEGSELVSVTNQLKMAAADGKKYNTDVMDTEQILRLIQSVPSKKAEPFKLWLARAGREMIDETIDPELSIDRAVQNYRRLGYKVVSGAEVAKDARKSLEHKGGEVISRENAKQLGKRDLFDKLPENKEKK